MDNKNLNHNVVLVIDDNPVLMAATSRALEKAGYEVLRATNGEEGLDLAFRHNPGLVLLDVVMPDVDGREVCRRIKAGHSPVDSYVVLMSSIETDSDSQAFGLESGADGYIARPISNRELVARTESMFRLKRAEDALRDHQAKLEELVEERTAELRQSEQMFRSMFENSMDGVLYTSHDGTILMCNPSACRILGRSSEEICKAGLQDIADPDDSSFARVMELGSQDGDAAFETNFIHAGGAKVPVEVFSSAFKCCSGGERATLSFRDITERKKMESALQETRDNFLAFFETIDDLTMVTTYDGEVIFFNSAVSRKLGYSSEEIKALGVLGLHPHSNRVEAQEIFSQMLRGERDVCPLPLQKRDGDFLPVETRVWHGRWSGQDCIFAICKDLSEEQESLQKFNRIFSLNPTPMAVSSMPERKFTEVNDAFLSVLGFSEPEIIGKTSAELGLFVSQTSQDNLALQLQDSGRVRDVDLQVRTKGGDIIEGVFSGEIIENHGKKSFLTVMTDVTEIRKAQINVRKSEKRFRELAELLPQTVFEMDMDHKFTFVNTAGLRLTGYTQEDCLEIADPFDLVVPEDRENLKEFLKKATMTEQMSMTPLAALKKDGSTVPILLYTAPIHELHKIVGLRAVVVDISDLKKTEAERDVLRDQLFQSQKLESLGTLVGGIAHDFNNMLQVIIGYIELFQGDHEFSDRFRKELETVYETGREGAALVKKLMAFGQQTPVARSRININDHIKRLETLISRSLPQVVRVELDLGADPDAILADSGSLDQVLMNLAINSAEAMPDGCKISISTTFVTLDEEHCRSHIWAKPGPHVMISFEDNGRGIKKENLPKIFDPFYSTKQRGTVRGTGLGLSVVRGIVQQHGGHVTCESEPGAGTLFRLYFPAMQTVCVPDSREKPKLASPQPGIVLIVEDNESVAELEQAVIQKGGYETLLMTSPVEALEKFRKKHQEISLVVLDLVMPELSGKECLKEMRRIDPDVKVLVVSGYGPDDYMVQEILHQVTGFLSKPCSNRELLEAVKLAISSEIHVRDTSALR